MAVRRECREWAVQLLFQLDLNPSDKLGAVFATFWKDKRKASLGSRAYTEGLVRGVEERKAEIDTYIRKIAENWSLERMGVLDRNVIRLAIYEMQHVSEVPPVVSINEAVDLAKYFSNKESGKFVNGILDRARKDTDRPARTPGGSKKG